MNYDVLRDIEFDLGQSTPNHDNQSHDTDEPGNQQTSPISSIDHVTPPTNDLAITRTPLHARLPSLSSRKRNFSSFGGLSPFVNQSPHPLATATKFVNNGSSGPLPNAKRTRVDSLARPVVSDSLKQLDEAVSALVEAGRHGGPCVPSVVVEESGPVEYCEEEGEGLDDEEMDDLIYEDDPLLAHSDNEDYNDGY